MKTGIGMLLTLVLVLMFGYNAYVVRDIFNGMCAIFLYDVLDKGAKKVQIKKIKLGKQPIAGN